MAHRSVIPFGPQHPVLPEPLHLDLVIEDDRVIEAIPQIGFVHRGLEKLTEKRDMHQFGYIAERICGICAVGHSYGYASACERMLDIEVPGRVQYIRTILHELSRIHSHLLWLGLLADAFGFEALFYRSWTLREQILKIFESTCGGRVILSAALSMISRTPSWQALSRRSMPCVLTTRLWCIRFWTMTAAASACMAWA